MTTIIKPTRFGTRFQRAGVADITDPSPELAGIYSLEVGGLLVVYETGSDGIFTLYGWQTSGTPSIPYYVECTDADYPGIWAAIGGRFSIAGNYEAVTIVTTTPYVVVDTDRNIYVDATIGNMVVSIPPATGSGRMLHIKKIAHLTNIVTITPDGAEAIDNNTSYPIRQLWAGKTIQDIDTGVWCVVN